MEYKDFYTIWNQYDDRARAILKLLLGHQNNPTPYFNHVDFDGKNITINFEYNYDGSDTEHDSFVIPADIFFSDIFIHDWNNKRIEAEKQKAKEQTTIYNREKELRERAEFERLSIKFYPRFKN